MAISTTCRRLRKIFARDGRVGPSCRGFVYCCLFAIQIQNTGLFRPYPKLLGLCSISFRVESALGSLKSRRQILGP